MPTSMMRKYKIKDTPEVNDVVRGLLKEIKAEYEKSIRTVLEPEVGVTDAQRERNTGYYQGLEYAIAKVAGMIGDDWRASLWKEVLDFGERNSVTPAVPDSQPTGNTDI